MTMDIGSRAVPHHSVRSRLRRLVRTPGPLHRAPCARPRPARSVSRLALCAPDMSFSLGLHTGLHGDRPFHIGRNFPVGELQQERERREDEFLFTLQVRLEQP